jgi:ATP-binding cassette subfamily D (ALD) long-chain fatty acid import protein
MINSLIILHILRSKSAQLKHFILHEIKTEKRIWKKYLQLIKYLNINPHAKPVWLFFLTLILFITSISSYQLIKLFRFLKPKSIKFIQKHPNLSRSVINLKLNSFKSNSLNERIIYVPYKNRILNVKIKLPNNDKYERDRLIFKKFMKEHESLKIALNNNTSTNNNTLNQTNNNLNLNFYSNQKIIKFQFFEKLSIIWNLILIPSLFDKNTYLMLSQIGFLIARTWLTLLVTKLDGQITKDLMSFNLKYFLRDMIYWFLFAVPASYINSGISYLTKRLSLNFRTNMIRYCHDLYMDSKLVYYKLQFNNNSIDDYKLNHETFNQYITEDIKRFCDSLTNLFTNVGKPTIDLIFFAIYLRDNIGNLGILGILLNYFITGLILKNYSPNFSKLWKIRSFLESIYYNYNLNLINNCEEISFYKGIQFERLKVNEIFNKLMLHLKFETNLRFKFQLLEDYILKSIWPAFGYFFASLPILFDSTSIENSLASSNIKSFTVNKRLILSMADAGSRLMYSIKDISRLNGLTDRIFTLLVNLHQVHDSNFMYGYIDSNKFKPTGGFGSTYNISSFASRSKLKGFINNNNNNNIINFENGTIQKNFPGLRFEHIDIIPPSIKGPFAKPILRNLNFKILQGENLIIHGKNGCGKTSIVRIISELWPLFNNGLLSKPANSDIFYVSQKQYFVNGSLRDQVIYPLNWKSCINRGYDDSKIKLILKDVGLDYLIDRFGLDYNPHGKGSQIEEILINDKSINLIDSYVAGNIDGKTNWDNLLSGGERQKLIFARILFHNKKLVVLDEPTSAISYDFEDILFDMLKKRGFTLVTISNRESLIKYHDYILRLNKNDEENEISNNNNNNEISDGIFSKIDEDYLRKFETLDNEIEYLQNEINKINQMKERKVELIELLEGYE